MSKKLSSFLSKLQSEHPIKENVSKFYYKDKPSEIYVLVRNYFDESLPEVIGIVRSNMVKYEQDNKEDWELHFLPDDPRIVEDVKKNFKAREFIPA